MNQNERIIMLLQASQITKRFGNKIVLRRLTINLNKGESVAILGPNGAGKTTLINILATLLKPTDGELTINSEDARKNPFRLRPQIGFVGSEPNAYLEFTPYENLKFFGQLYGVKNLDAKIDELLEHVGLVAFAREPIKIFSSGMLKRFSIIKALIHKPDILLFDEPFTGLDAVAKQFVLNLIRDERTRGTGIIFSTHDIELAYEAASKFTFLFGGRIEEVAKKEEIGLDDLKRKYEQRIQHTV